jgi:hypothetical protein
MRKSILTSKFLSAVIAFGAVSMLAGWYQFCATAPAEFPYRSWTAWAIDDFLQQKQAPKVVFMGSSLVLVPVAGVDADYLNKRLDGSQHHRSLYFEQKFQQRTGISAPTFNFALPGEMPSDAFMITSYLLKNEKTPNLIIYGVGPRDFMDNLLPSPSATDPYRFLSRFGDVSPWASLMMPDWFDRFSYEAGRAIYMYGHKGDIADKLTAMAAVPVSNVAPLPSGAQPMSRDDMHTLMPEYHPFELHRGDAFFRPSTPEERAKFVDNIDEYRKRYKKLKMETFLTQMRFFTQTLGAAREHGTHVVVVAMPITDINRQLISDESWEKYRQSIKAVAQAQGCTFVDFNASNDFVRTDFGDTVHLHSAGGRLWLDKLVERLGDDQAIAAYLKAKPEPSPETLASQKGGAL